MKKILNVKKFIKKKLNGGRLKEEQLPKIINKNDLNIKFFFNLI